jgi:hypothetical protein
MHGSLHTAPQGPGQPYKHIKRGKGLSEGMPFITNPPCSTYTRVHAHTHTRMHTPTHVRTQARTSHTHACTYTHLHAHAQTHIRKHTQHAHAHAHVYTDTHTVLRVHCELGEGSVPESAQTMAVSALRTNNIFSSSQTAMDN